MTSTTLTLRGAGLTIVLDAREIIPDDPGAGTPALVTCGRHTGTYFCALDTGDLGGVYTLTDAQRQWLDDQFDRVEAFLADHSPEA